MSYQQPNRSPAGCRVPRCAHLDERATSGEPHDRCNHPRGPIPMHDGCVWHTATQTLRRAANSLPRA